MDKSYGVVGLIAGLIVLVLAFGILALNYLLTAGIVWVGCWALGLMGVSVIWSWKLALGIWVLWIMIRLVLDAIS